MIQEEFAVFAASFVRLAATWLHQTYPDAPPPFDHAQASVKQMVRIAANTLAWVIWWRLFVEVHRTEYLRRHRVDDW
jgi:hypothetical protein